MTKGAKQKEHEADVEIRGKFTAIRQLFHGLKRSRRDYPAVESIEWEPIPGGQVLILRMLYPFEKLHIELADEQITELINRAEGKTAEGVAIATPEEMAKAIQMDREARHVVPYELQERP